MRSAWSSWSQPATSRFQFGFLRGRSAFQQLLVFYTDIQESVSACSQSDVIYLDFTKAFDSVPHNELLVKLRSLGICGQLWSWFRCYLTNRQQCVCIKGSRSPLALVISGVPQGSLLGPLLFLVYINDLPTEAILLLFADDSKCARLIKSMADRQLLQEDLDHLCSWSIKWNMKFKDVKCALLSFSRRAQKFMTRMSFMTSQFLLSLHTET